jgi:hypothetical protein
MHQPGPQAQNGGFGHKVIEDGLLVGGHIFVGFVGARVMGEQTFEIDLV